MEESGQLGALCAVGALCRVGALCGFPAAGVFGWGRPPAGVGRQD